MGRGVYRGIYSALTDDPDFLRLSPHAKLVFYTLRLSKEAGPAAIFVCYQPLIVAKTGLGHRHVTMALDELAQANWIYRDGPLVWIRNGLRHDPTSKLSNDNHRAAVLKWVEALPRLPLLVSFCKYYELPMPSGMPSPMPSEGHPNGKGDHRNQDSGFRSTDTESYIALVRPKEGPEHRVLAWLNQKAGTHYRPVAANLDLIRARLKDGISEIALRVIVTHKTRQWLGDSKMAKYLRPETLFNKTKCEQYLGELPREIPSGDSGDA